jgi:hypothetical protein
MNTICGRVAPRGSVAAGFNGKTRSAGVKRASATMRASGRRLGKNNGRARMLIVRATDGPESSTLDYQGALKFLGLSESASSEDMVRAKNQMLSRYKDEEEKLKTVSATHEIIVKRKTTNNSPFGELFCFCCGSVPAHRCTRGGGQRGRYNISSDVNVCPPPPFACYTQVESAYDVVLMKSLMKRSQGEVSDNRVKYADVLSPGAAVRQKLPPWARDLTNKLPPRPAFESPDSETLTQSGIALGVLAALVLAQGCTQVRSSYFLFHYCFQRRTRIFQQFTPSLPNTFAFAFFIPHSPPTNSSLFFATSPQPPGVDDPPGLQLSLALFGSVWLLKKKNITLGAFFFSPHTKPYPLSFRVHKSLGDVYKLYDVDCVMIALAFSPFFPTLSPRLTRSCSRR